ncbi:protein-glutamate O-methyltransferase CheR [Alteribacter keqinensis]|uniref:protein-glutamate O-methyltransferase n=2 Tax=Alteribacter keqinensis TaxID=2483800 RepID=A0A3M7TYA3_9BACI|nr:protein-glutamate O-methyltransferase CheR [Alteribacter keqinensis]
MLKDDYQMFTVMIKDKTGIDLNQYKEAQMKRRLLSLREKRGFATFSDYGKEMGLQNDLFEEFLDRMTINVSEFYRNPERWDVLKNKILPVIKEKKNVLKIWSAACSTGEEPYTLSMMMKETRTKARITATDIDDTILKRAKRGAYPERSLKELPLEWKDRYFQKDGPGYEIDQKVKTAVSFNKHNLLKDAYPKEMDLIVCRNVLIYFTEEAKQSIYKRLADSLVSSGILFVGSTEQIFNPSKYGFEAEDTFFYRKQ